MNRIITKDSVIPEVADALTTSGVNMFEIVQDMAANDPKLYSRFVDTNGFSDWNLQNGLAHTQSGDLLNPDRNPLRDDLDVKFWGNYCANANSTHPAIKAKYDKGVDLTDKLSASIAVLQHLGDDSSVEGLLKTYFRPLVPNLELATRIEQQNTEYRADPQGQFDMSQEDAVKELGGLIDLYQKGQGRFSRFLVGKQEHLFTDEEIEFVEKPTGALSLYGGLPIDPVDPTKRNDNDAVLRTAYAIAKVTGDVGLAAFYLNGAIPNKIDPVAYFEAEHKRS